VKGVLLDESDSEEGSYVTPNTSDDSDGETHTSSTTASLQVTRTTKPPKTMLLTTSDKEKSKTKNIEKSEKQTLNQQSRHGRMPCVPIGSRRCWGCWHRRKKAELALKKPGGGYGIIFSGEFTNVRLGLWALEEFEIEIIHRCGDNDNDEQEDDPDESSK